MAIGEAGGLVRVVRHSSTLLAQEPFTAERAEDAEP